MKRSTLLPILLLFIQITLNSQSISGTWVFNGNNMNITMILNPDGTGEFQGLPIKYRTQEGQLFIDDGISPVVYNYKINQNTLLVSESGTQMAITFVRPANSSGSFSDQGGVALNQSQEQFQNANQSQNQNKYQINNSAGYNQNYPNSFNSSSNNGSISGHSSVRPGGSNLEGIWEGIQGKIILYPDGNMLFNNVSYKYSVSGSTMTINGTDGSISFNYSISGNSLTLSQNTNSALYTKTSSLKPEIIDQQLVGKWCIISSNYNSYSGGGSSSEECITLKADGTYIYSYSAERTGYASNQSVYGGTSNQNGDHGTWKTDGLTISSFSQTAGTNSRYSFSKENNENGDPMIVIGGKKFVTAYKRPRW